MFEFNECFFQRRFGPSTAFYTSMSFRTIFFLAVIWLDPSSLSSTWSSSPRKEGMLVRASPSNPDNSKLYVQTPHSLNKEEGYDHRSSLFGIPPYGGSIAQNVYYADSTFCDSGDIDPTKGYPERPDNAPWPAPYILMVDRGDCSFVKKVRNAQHTGAAAVLIADNTCFCSDSECVSSVPRDACQISEPIMADDGSGSDISIPSFLMFKLDADKIKDELKRNQPVQVEMKWNPPQPDDRVEYELWTTPVDASSLEIMKNFKPVAVSLGDRAYFTPHYYIYDGVKSHCRGNNGENQCYNLCTNMGRYCATDPDNDLEKGLSGADVVRESLRRLCVWTRYGAEDGVGEKWWDYVHEFMDRCNSTERFTDQECIENVYDYAEIDGHAIELCMMDSGDVTKDVTNAKLEMEIASQNARGIVVVPTATVNTVAIRGALTPSNLLGAVCAGYLEGSRPEVCTQCTDCEDDVST